MRFGKWVKLVIGLLAFVLLVGVVLLIMEWRPDPQETTPIISPTGAHRDESPQGVLPGKLSLLSWNLGYAGLDARADFFMDGGEQVMPSSRDRVQQNMDAVAKWLSHHKADVMLLQEVDFNSKRTFGQDEGAILLRALPGYFSSRALNFKVAYIPYPMSQPLGRMNSGLLTLTINKPTSATRLQLPGFYPWPVRVFHLKRCIHEVHLAAPDGKDWVFLHLHLSAFDKDGELRTQQMDFLRVLMLRLYSQGHHVVVGGDWNHVPPGLDEHSFSRASLPFWLQSVPKDWTPAGWKWVFDKSAPSLRATSEPYTPGRTFTTTVDAFLVGPDIDIDQVRVEDLGFANSDHNPLFARVHLAQDSHESP